jgi:hypothetical protein
MLSRILFACVTIFWIVMNVLLWRSEYASKNSIGTPVPVQTVWEKILAAPDHSSLEIFHHKKKIGFCRWSPVVTEKVFPNGNSDEEISPEGMVRQVTGYRIDLDGNVGLEDFASRLRFGVIAKFSTNHIWQELALNMNLRPLSWEIRASAVEKAVHLEIEDDSGKTEHVFKFADLRNPQKLAQTLETPLPFPLIAMGLPLDSKVSSPGFQWRARNDWFEIAHTSVRAYVLETRILDRYTIKVIVSRAGEILRVELPNEVVLVNDQLIVF